jgi:hypothetical protein
LAVANDFRAQAIGVFLARFQCGNGAPKPGAPIDIAVGTVTGTVTITVEAAHFTVNKVG